MTFGDDGRHGDGVVVDMEVDKVADEVTDSCKMSNLLHGPESSNQILPREKHVNRDIFSQQNRPEEVSCDE